MQKKYEVNSNSSLSEFPPEIHPQIQALGKCIHSVEKKFGLQKLKGTFCSETNKVSVILFNGRNGPETSKTDEENNDAIEFFKTFQPQITKQENAYSYWSNSVITFDVQKLESMNEALERLNDQEPVERMVARC